MVIPSKRQKQMRRLDEHPGPSAAEIGLRFPGPRVQGTGGTRHLRIDMRNLSVGGGGDDGE